MFEWYDRNKDKNPLRHTVELAALVRLKFVTIHPFGDGNGRVSRLFMNFVMNKEGYPMLNIHYSARNSYYTALLWKERRLRRQTVHSFVGL
ncbi:MAG: hypothetical protein DLM72_05280 [Candidatus Nitrosopolaris wilkensis]|nr:MAG: hypothetical protein DLM72_05280 [Candidatus Nitrosopolaris wilkensis]